MKKAFYFLLLFVFSISFLSCDDDDKKTTNPIDQLPPITQTGKNTFGCLINGEPFIVRNTYNQVAIYQGGLLQLGGGVENANMDIGIRIILQDPLEENISYDLTNFPIHRSRYINYNEYYECEYNYQNTFEGSIIFSKIDTINYIVSGTFEFSTTTEQCDTIKIANGRFDVKYIP